MAKQNEVQRFLTKLSYAQPKEGEFGITWLELYTLYKAMGHDCLVSDPEAKAKARPSMGAQIRAFQFIGRRLVRSTIKEDRKQLFTCGRKKGYALKRLGINSHVATLNCLIRVNAQVQSKIDKEILKANGAKRHEVNDMLAGRKTIEVKKLSVRRKTTWSKGIERL